MDQETWKRHLHLCSCMLIKYLSFVRRCAVNHGTGPSSKVRDDVDRFIYSLPGKYIDMSSFEVS